MDIRLPSHIWRSLNPIPDIWSNFVFFHMFYLFTWVYLSVQSFVWLSGASQSDSLVSLNYPMVVFSVNSFGLFCQNWKLYWKRKKILVALTTRLQGERKMVKVNSVSECLDIGTQHNACASGRIWCLWSEKNMTWNLESRTVMLYTIKIQKRNSDAVKRGRSTRYHNSFSNKKKRFLLSSIETFYKALIV